MGWVIMLETKHFTLEAFGSTEEIANEAMGRALKLHEQRHWPLEKDWWTEYDFRTTQFDDGAAYIDGERV